jgi:hypothetical protein
MTKAKVSPRLLRLALAEHIPAANQNIPDFSARKCNTREIAKDLASATVA